MSKFKEGDKVRIKSVEEMKRDCPEGYDWKNGIYADSIEKFLGEIFTVSEVDEYGQSYLKGDAQNWSWVATQLELVVEEELPTLCDSGVTVKDDFEIIMGTVMELESRKFKAHMLRAVADIIDEEMNNE